MATETPTEEVHIGPERVQIEGDRDVHLVGHEVVASYNWGVNKDRTFVPGHPPIFLPSRIKDRFTLDQGDAPGGLYEHYRNVEDAAKARSLSRGEALIDAVKLCSPDLDMRSVDVVADRFVLSQLLRFCGSPGNSHPAPARFGDEEDYKVLVYDINSPVSGDYDDISTPTIVFSRVGSEEYHVQKRQQQQSRVRGFGTRYRARITETKAGVPKDAKPKYRMVTKVALDGVEILLRFKVDAIETSSSIASPSASQTVTSTSLKCAKEGGTAPTQDILSPESTVSSQKISACKDDNTVMSGSPNAKHITSGNTLPSDAKIVEVTTKNSRYAHEIGWRNLYWHISLGGVDKLVIGLHQNGVFNGSWKNSTLEMTRAQVKRRAARGTDPLSLSMIYLANTLREITKAAERVLPLAPLTLVDGALRRVAIIDFPSPTPGTGGRGRTLRVRAYEGGC